MLSFNTQSLKVQHPSDTDCNTFIHYGNDPESTVWQIDYREQSVGTMVFSCKMSNQQYWNIHAYVHVYILH